MTYGHSWFSLLLAGVILLWFVDGAQAGTTSRISNWKNCTGTTKQFKEADMMASTFEEADNVCNCNGGILALPASLAENKCIVDLASGAELFLGYRYDPRHVLTYASGPVIISESQTFYASGEPSAGGRVYNPHSGIPDQCVKFKNTGQGQDKYKWDDTPCRTQMRFVCQRTATGPLSNWEHCPGTTKQFKAADSTVSTFGEADNVCKHIGGILALPASLAENKCIVDRAPGADLFLGYRYDPRDTLTYVNGSVTITWPHTFYASGEPSAGGRVYNPYSGIPDQCVKFKNTLQGEDKYKWDDTPCPTQMRFVCQRTATCKLSNWEHCPGTTKQFKEADRMVSTFAEADYVCKRIEGGILALPASLAENKCIVDRAPGAQLFLGYRYDPRHTLTYVNGSVIITRPHTFYAPGEPSAGGRVYNPYSGIPDQCVKFKNTVQGQDRYKWDDTPCRTQMRFVCQRTAKVSTECDIRGKKYQIVLNPGLQHTNLRDAFLSCDYYYLFSLESHLNNCTLSFIRKNLPEGMTTFWSDGNKPYYDVNTYVPYRSTSGNVPRMTICARRKHCDHCSPRQQCVRNGHEQAGRIGPSCIREAYRPTDKTIQKQCEPYSYFMTPTRSQRLRSIWSQYWSWTARENYPCRNDNATVPPPSPCLADYLQHMFSRREVHIEAAWYRRQSDGAVGLFTRSGRLVNDWFGTSICYAKLQTICNSQGTPHLLYVHLVDGTCPKGSTLLNTAVRHACYMKFADSLLKRLEIPHYDWNAGVFTDQQNTPLDKTICAVPLSTSCATTPVYIPYGNDGRLRMANRQSDALAQCGNNSLIEIATLNSGCIRDFVRDLLATSHSYGGFWAKDNPNSVYNLFDSSPYARTVHASQNIITLCLVKLQTVKLQTVCNSQGTPHRLYAHLVGRTCPVGSTPLTTAVQQQCQMTFADSLSRALLIRYDWKTGVFTDTQNVPLEKTICAVPLSTSCATTPVYIPYGNDGRLRMANRKIDALAQCGNNNLVGIATLNSGCIHAFIRGLFATNPSYEGFWLNESPNSVFNLFDSHPHLRRVQASRNIITVCSAKVQTVCNNQGIPHLLYAHLVARTCPMGSTGLTTAVQQQCQMTFADSFLAALSISYDWNAGVFTDTQNTRLDKTICAVPLRRKCDDFGANSVTVYLPYNTDGLQIARNDTIAAAQCGSNSLFSIATSNSVCTRDFMGDLLAANGRNARFWEAGLSGKAFSVFDSFPYIRGDWPKASQRIVTFCISSPVTK